MQLRLGLLSLLLIGTAAGAQNSPSIWVGSWNLNVAQSKLHPPGVKNETITMIAPTDSLAVKWSATGTRGDGTQINVSYDGKADGNHYPLMSNGQEVGKIMYIRLSKGTNTAHFILNDGRAWTDTSVMSKDNKTFTVHRHATGSRGTYDETVVWNKQ
jgi:hypothetical protein